MSLPRRLFTPSFRHRQLGSAFAAIVAIMVFIAAFATATEVALVALGLDWSRAMSDRLTVEIPAVTTDTGQPQAERVRQAVAVLRALPAAELVMPMSDDEVAHLLQPWFAQPELLQSLALPTLIDVERRPGTSLNAAEVAAALKNVVPDAHVDDHGDWTQDIWRLMRGLSVIGFLTIGLTGVTLVIAVSLICRAVMAAEHETILLLHYLGADDSVIARHFQGQARSIAIRAALAGFVCAAIAAGLLLWFSRHAADLIGLGPVSWAQVGGASLAVPIAAVVIASVTARMSVMRVIRALP